MFKIIRGDITKLEVDAIVNSANHTPLDKEPFGTDRAIHRAAGVNNLLQARQEIGKIEFGEVGITKAFDLEPKVKYILHAVAPIWRGGTAGEANVLQSCYKKSLELALRMGFESIAFPVMAAGINGVPVNEALKIAIDGITDFLFEHVDYKIDVTLVIFDREMFELCERIFPNIEKHLDEEVIEALAMEEYEGNLPDIQDKQQLKKTPEILVRCFADEVYYLLEESIKSGKFRREKDFFSKANISDRVRRDMKNKSKEYSPHRNTAIRIALTLGLSLNETQDLLSKAKYSLADNNPRDLAIRDFINKKIFDVYKVDELLHKKGLDSIMEP